MSIAVGLMQHQMGLASDENKELRIDHAGMSSHHAMRQAEVDLERSMSEQLCLQK